MDAVKAFFAKYHAVPATGAGPQWERATDEALLGWALGSAESWDANPQERGALRSRMADLGNELYRRLSAMPTELWIPAVGPRPLYSRLLNAWTAVFQRIGYRWAVTD